MLFVHQTNMYFFMPKFYVNHKTIFVGLAACVSAIGIYKFYKHRRAHAGCKYLPASVTAAVEPESPPFENMYLKEYDEMPDDPQTEVPGLNLYIQETTPQGVVIMNYNATNETFGYYSDKWSIQFKYLEPLARKYVLTYGCKRLYIDIRKNFINHPSSPPKREVPKSESIFATFKNYKKHPPPIPLKKNVTRYLHCGKLVDFNANSNTTDEDFNLIKPIDYASYKKQNTDVNDNHGCNDNNKNNTDNEEDAYACISTK